MILIFGNILFAFVVFVFSFVKKFRTMNILIKYNQSSVPLDTILSFLHFFLLRIIFLERASIRAWYSFYLFFFLTIQNISEENYITCNRKKKNKISVKIFLSWEDQDSKKKKQYQKTVLKILNYYVNIKIQFSRNFYFLNESMELISYFDSLLHTKSLFDTIHRALTEIPTVKWHENCVKTSPISVLILSLV